MATTACDLYRAGNASGPKFDQIRSGEVVIHTVNGIDTVVARSGGISTQDAPGMLRGKWSKLPAGTAYDESVLFLFNDFPGHWSWEAAVDMPVADYIAALAKLTTIFVPV